MNKDSQIEEKGLYGFSLNEDKDDIDISAIDLNNPIKSYHPLFYYEESGKIFNIGHMTDLHLVSRQQLLKKSRARVIEYVDEGVEKDTGVSSPVGDI